MRLSGKTGKFWYSSALHNWEVASTAQSGLNALLLPQDCWGLSFEVSSTWKRKVRNSIREPSRWTLSAAACKASKQTRALLFPLCFGHAEPSGVTLWFLNEFTSVGPPSDVEVTGNWSTKATVTHELMAFHHLVLVQRWSLTLLL